MSEANNSFWEMLITGVAALGVNIAVLFRVKGASDVRIKNIEDDMERQDKRIETRVHTNDFESHKKLIETKFEYIAQSLDRIEKKADGN